MYVEMADRISSRRNLANVFFLTINSTVLSVAGFSFDKLASINPKWFICFPVIGILVICIVWWWILRSYRNLNSAKFKVIGQLETKLPASPYWSAEWAELGQGKDIKKYLPLTVLETSIPIIFALIYILSAMAFIVI